jgi:riboflavin biosynthesis pyrimidine reductase
VLPQLTPDTVRDWQDVSTLSEHIYGANVSSHAGVGHIAAVWRDPHGGHHSLRLTADAPGSTYDQFALGLSRARADAILTTGKILRSEPGLTHDYLGPSTLRHALAEWRMRSLGKTESARSVILTSGERLPRSHPLFRGTTRPMIVTSSEGARRLGAWAAAADVQVVAMAEPSAEQALRYLAETMGARALSIEAGPHTALPLYRSPTLVDELWLSTYLGPSVATSVLGPAFLDAASLDAAFPRRATPFKVNEPSGPWQFQRFTRVTQ